MNVTVKLQSLFIFLFSIAILVGCTAPNENDENKRNTQEELLITEDFDLALKETLDEINRAVDVDVEPEHFDYDKSSVVLTVSGGDTFFGQFVVDLTFAQLIDTEGYAFTLYDANKAEKPVRLDLANLDHAAKLIMHNPHVPAGTYKALALEFNFDQSVVNAYLDGKHSTVYLISDDGLTFGIDQQSYRMSVDLASTPVMLPSNDLLQLNLQINLDESVRGMPVLKNALDAKAAYLFHPSMHVDINDSQKPIYIDGKFVSVVDKTISLIPEQLTGSDQYQHYFNDNLLINVHDKTQFFVNYEKKSFEDGIIDLAQDTDGYVRIEGTLDKKEAIAFTADHLAYISSDNKAFSSGVIINRSSEEVQLLSSSLDLTTFEWLHSTTREPISSFSKAYTWNPNERSQNFSDFSKLWQRVGLASLVSGKAIIFPRTIRVAAAKVNGNTATTEVMDHDGYKALTVFLSGNTKLAAGDTFFAQGYFFGSYFISDREWTYPNNFAEFSVWLDEMPPNNALNHVFMTNNDVEVKAADEEGKLIIQPKTINDFYLSDSILDKSAITYKVAGERVAFDREEVSRVLFDDSASFFLESYSMINPHISVYDTYGEMSQSLAEHTSGGGHIYSIIAKGKLSGSKLLANSNNGDLLKIRLRGRNIDTALARTLWDDDYHGARKWGGLTLTQIGILFGSAVGLLVLDYILEKMKLGPKAQLTAPDFCKPGKKQKPPQNNASMVQKAASKAKGLGSAVGSIGGIASCLRKLANFSDAKEDLRRLSNQINPDALYVDGEKGRNSALLLLSKKKLSKKGANFYKDPAQRQSFQKLLNASDTINHVFNRKFLSKSELKPGVSDMAMRLKVNLTPKLNKDHDVFSKLIDMDNEVRKRILTAVADGNISLDQDADKDKFQKALNDAAKAGKSKKATRQSVVDAFNKAIGSEKINLATLDEAEKTKAPLSDQEIATESQRTLKQVEKAFLKYQIDPEANIENLRLVTGLSLKGDVEANQVEVFDKMKHLRTDTEIRLNEVSAHKAEVLTAMKNGGALRSNTFFEFQADSLIREQLIDDMKKTIIQAETSSDGERVDVNKLMDRYKTAKKTTLASNDVNNKTKALQDTLNDMATKTKNFIVPEGDFSSILKKKKR